jgi:hypothetical protein
MRMFWTAEDLGPLVQPVIILKKKIVSGAECRILFAKLPTAGSLRSDEAGQSTLSEQVGVGGLVCVACSQAP